MTTFLGVVAVLSGLIGLIALFAGPSFTGPIWWVLTLLSLIGIPVLNYLKRIAVATENRGAVLSDAQPVVQKGYRDPDFSKQT